MGFLTDLFGDEGDRAAIFNEQFDAARGDLISGYGEFQSYIQQAMGFLMAERGENLAQYRQDYQQGIAALEGAISSARNGMSGAFNAQRTLLAQGFSATKKEIGDQFSATRGRQATRNAFTGLGQTTFGDATLSAIDAEGAKQIGMVDERQRMAQVELEGEQTRIRNQFELAAGGALMQSQAGLAQGTIGNSQAYAMPYANMLGQIGQAGLNTYGGIAQLQSGLGQQLASNTGSGFNLGGVLIGGAAAAIGGAFAGPAGATAAAGAVSGAS